MRLVTKPETHREKKKKATTLTTKVTFFYDVFFTKRFLLQIEVTGVTSKVTTFSTFFSLLQIGKETH